MNVIKNNLGNELAIKTFNGNQKWLSKQSQSNYVEKKVTRFPNQNYGLSGYGAVHTIKN